MEAGYRSKVLFVDLTHGRIQEEVLPEALFSRALGICEGIDTSETALSVRPHQKMMQMCFQGPIKFGSKGRAAPPNL